MKIVDGILNVLLFRRVSIRTKVVFMIVFLSAVFGAGILGFVYYQLQNTLKDEALNKALILADGLSVKAAEPVQVEDLNALQFILGEAIGQAPAAVLHASVVDAETVGDQGVTVDRRGRQARWRVMEGYRRRLSITLSRSKEIVSGA